MGAFGRFGVHGAVLLVWSSAVEAALGVGDHGAVRVRAQAPGGAGFVEDGIGDFGFWVGESADAVEVDEKVGGDGGGEEPEEAGGGGLADGYSCVW